MRHFQKHRLTWLAVGCFLLAKTNAVQAQVYGCKDPAATNYNPAATDNNNSCTYSTTNYTPPIVVDPLPSSLNENSALQMAGGFLWTLNDGNNSTAIYRISKTTGAILQTVDLENTSNIDWEDLAFDGTNLYVGDFGNNGNGARTNLKIYKFPLSAIPDYTTETTATVLSTAIETINFTYADQPQPPVSTTSENTAFDCEAFIVDGGKIHLFTKDWVTSPSQTKHYVINSTVGGTYVATAVETLATNFLVTAADKVPGSNVIVLLGYQKSIPFYHFLYFLFDYSGGLYFNGNKRLINLPVGPNLNPVQGMGQAEGITFVDGKNGYISNEYVSQNGFTVLPRLRSFNTDNFVPMYVLPLKLKSFAVTKKNNQNQIAWNFTEPAKSLQVQHSTNGVDFKTIYIAATATKGETQHQASTTVSWYRLAWKEDGGAEKYSDIIRVKNAVSSAMAKTVLRSNGDLSFELAAPQEGDYQFRLLTSDGKLLAQKSARLATAGATKIAFAQNLSRNAILFLEIVHATERSSIKLNVQ